MESTITNANAYQVTPEFIVNLISMNALQNLVRMVECAWISSMDSNANVHAVISMQDVLVMLMNVLQILVSMDVVKMASINSYVTVNLDMVENDVKKISTNVNRILVNMAAFVMTV